MIQEIAKAEAMNANCRPSMEDRAVVHPPGTWNVKDPDLAEHLTYLGIYDGHGGRDIVDFLEHGLSHHISEELSYNDGTDIRTKLQRAFLMADIHSQKAGLMTSGSTVASLLIQQYPENPQQVRLITANVGDARIILHHNQQVERLTRDHTPDDPLEVARIVRDGGFLARRRVLGTLAVTRSIGDHMLKKYVIAEPHVCERMIEAGENTFLIMACDGLWDTITDEEAAEMVRDFIGPRNQAAAFLVQEAIRRGTTDNVTALVVWL